MWYFSCSTLFLHMYSTSITLLGPGRNSTGGSIQILHCVWRLRIERQLRSLQGREGPFFFYDDQTKADIIIAGRAIGTDVGRGVGELLSLDQNSFCIYHQFKNETQIHKLLPIIHPSLPCPLPLLFIIHYLSLHFCRAFDTDQTTDQRWWK